MDKLVLQNADLQNLVEVIDLGFNLVDALKAAKANDGQVDFKDWPLLFPIIGDVGVAVDGLEKIPTAYTQSTLEDRTKVMNYLNERFTLPNPITEAKVEKVMLVAASILDLVLDLKK